MLFRNMSSSETTGNFSAASTQYFTENAGLQLEVTVSAFPLSSHSDSGEGDFSRLYYGSLALRPAALLAPLVGADRTYTQPTRTFTSGLPMVWSPAPSPDITTAPTGKLALAGLPPARSSTSFTARLQVSRDLGGGCSLPFHRDRQGCGDGQTYCGALLTSARCGRGPGKGARVADNQINAGQGQRKRDPLFQRERTAQRIRRIMLPQEFDCETNTAV